MVAYATKSNTSVGGQVDRDNAHLQRMGKKPVLKVCNASFKVITSYPIGVLILISETSAFSRSSVSAVLFWALGKACLG